MTTPNQTSAPAKPDQPAAKGGDEKNRYRATLNLPQTPFPMKANLVQNEPASIKRWEKLGLYRKVREARKEAPKFAFHDGPPYANGSIHLGHMLNKCLKDFVVRSRSMGSMIGGRLTPMDCPFVPGWDCHGLPIEHKVMQELVESGKVAKLNTLEEWTRKTAVRRECQKYAEKFHKLHTTQFTRLLTLADYENPYLTMQPSFEAATLEVLAELLARGLVYRAVKPVHWSIANETALAEAELEYYDREDLSVYVDFEAENADAVYDAFGLPPHGDDEDDESDASAENGEESAAKSRAPMPGVRPFARPSFMIWTTTPWTLPANLAIAVNPAFTYALVWVDGNVTVMAEGAIERVTKMANSEDVVVLATAPGEKLLGLRYRHPFVDAAALRATDRFEPTGHKADPATIYTVVGAEYVTLEDGTGLVHTAPGHGAEDFQTGLRIGLPVYCPVMHDGKYFDAPCVPLWLRGVSIWDANPQVVQHLRNSGHLFYDHKFMHSYPHDWRSKTPVVFRCTKQWFITVDAPAVASKTGGSTGNGLSLRSAALLATGDASLAVNDISHSVNGSIDTQLVESLAGCQLHPGLPPHQSLREKHSLGKVNGSIRFVPEWGRNRMRGMLEARPDWCISRQRAWGLPIPAFSWTDADGGERTLMTAASVRAVASKVREKGSDIWFSAPAAELLSGYDAANDPELDADARASFLKAGDRLRKGSDILDVWFESGSTWNAVMRQRGLGFPADLYLEGSDQHRGWFQASLLPSLGVTGQPPFKALVTHGFIVAKDGTKLSKSKGDTIEDLFADYGVDVLRWWASSLAYENDVKADREFFDTAGEAYRKVRNTLRFMLSNLSDFTPGAAHSFPPASLEAWVLSRFDALSRTVVEAYDRYDFRAANLAIYEFCNTTLSAEYLAAVKDRLYCDKADSPRRRATQAALFTLTDGLCRLLAPILCHTADEAWRALHRCGPDDARCVHLETFLADASGAAGTGTKAHEKFDALLAALAPARVAMEKAKSGLGVENPLDMGIVLPDRDGAFAAFNTTDIADLLGVSIVSLDASATEAKVTDLRATHERCERSWKRDGTVKRRADGGLLSDRDAAAVGAA